jgi:hypothetical protein
MTLNDLFPSKYLAKEDVPTPTVATMQQVTQVEMNDNGVKVMKPILVLSAFRKPLVLNKLNAQSVAAVYGSDTSAWVGKPIEVFVDPNVMMQGRMVGGLRLRAPSANGHHAAPTTHSTTTAAPAGVVLWDYSDGQNVVTRQTTEQVMDTLTDLFDQGVNLDGIRVRPSGTKDTPLVGSAWRKLHGDQTPAPAGGDNFPF